MYQKQAEELLLMINKMSGDKGQQNLSQDDKESVESFRELSKMHKRQMNFLELRLRDPDSLYEVDEVRAKFKPKKQALKDKHLVNKGMMRANPAKENEFSAKKQVLDHQMAKQPSDLSDGLKLAGDNENPDDQVY